MIVFQDQVLEVAMALAGFSAGEAEGLRRAMSRKRSLEALEAHCAPFRRRARSRTAWTRRPADMVFDKLVGFSGFGFPKSHAAAFALLAYQSAWLRRHYPAEFLCALLNAQPMGFYPPATLVRDGERRGVEVLPPDVNASEAACAIEDGAVRVGLGYVKGVGEKEAEAVAAGQPYADIRDLAQRAPTDQGCARGARRVGRVRLLRRAAARAALAARPRPPAAERPGHAGEAKQLALPLEPTAECRSCLTRHRGSACSPTTGRRASPSARTRWSCCGRCCQER